MRSIAITSVDDEATPYATFQSHNQKMIRNRRGLFMTYLKSRNEAYTEQGWRLMWNREEGAGFEVLYESVDPTNPPPLETDANDTLYVVYPNFVDGSSYLLRFVAERDYADPESFPIPGSAAGKVCLLYDRHRNVLYYYTSNSSFHIMALDGSIVHSVQLAEPGPHAAVEYPHLSLDEEGTLHAAWTTDKYGTYHYWSIQYMRSRDGGYSWERLDGTPIGLPVGSDDAGASDRISTDDELGTCNTWLASFAATGGKLHFMYRSIRHVDFKVTPQHYEAGIQRYVRYDMRSGRPDRESAECTFSGESIRIAGSDGFFAVDRRPGSAPGRLFYVSKAAGRIAAVGTEDNGNHWKDVALGDEMRDDAAIYAITGCREVTEDGRLIGAFTERLDSFADPFGRTKVHFIACSLNGTAD